MVAASAARSKEPVYGLISLVADTDTDPGLVGNSWGDTQHTLRLTPDRLLSDLKTAFKDDDAWFCDSRHGNPYEMPGGVMRTLPRTIMVFAKLDILY